MSIYPKRGLSYRSKSSFERKIVAVPVLAAVFWLFLQKGCVLTPDISPAHTTTDTRQDSIEPAFATVGKEKLAVTRSQSLRHASELLKKAAVMLEKNERIAVRLILQAIAILKEHVLRGTDSPEYGHVSIGQAPSKREQRVGSQVSRAGWSPPQPHEVEVGPQHRNDLIRSPSTREGGDEMGLNPWR